MAKLKLLLWIAPRRAVANWLADDAMLLAAAMAYYFAIAVFPLVIVLISLLGVVIEWTQIGQDAERRVIEAASNQISPSVAEELDQLLETISEEAPTSGPVGALILLATAVALFVQFDRALDRIWNVPQVSGRSIFATLKYLVFIRLKAFLMLLSLLGLVLIAFVVSLAWTGVDEQSSDIKSFWSKLVWWLRQVVNLAINIGAFTLLYRIVPKLHVRWGDALAGGLLAAVLWEVGRQVLAAYVIGQKYSSAYGIIGSFLAIMLWCYYGAAVLFLGAEYTQALGNEKNKHDRSEPTAP